MSLDIYCFLKAYSQPRALERLLLLIFTLVEHPGIGSPEASKDVSEGHHDALKVLCDRLHEVAKSRNIECSCSTHTIRKDIGFLRQFGILSPRMYRWGYFLGTGIMTRSELHVALNALAAQANYQKDPQVRKLYESLAKRLKTIDPTGAFLYPVRTQFNQSIIHTDPIEMMSNGNYRQTLFHRLEQLEKSILKGEKIQLCHSRNPYNNRQTGYVWVYPLQMIHSNIAWYLLYENCTSNHLAITRLDRFSDHYQLAKSSARGLTAQRESLEKAHQLLKSGWGLFLGSPQEQQLELQGKLTLTEIKVRFFSPILHFILEGERRHRSQKITKGPVQEGTLRYVDYAVTLPPRSIDEFSRWVYGFMGKAKFIKPMQSALAHYNAANSIVNCYQSDF